MRKAPAPEGVRFAEPDALFLDRMVVMVTMVVMMVSDGGECRGRQHRHQEGSGQNFLHGLNVAPERRRGASTVPVGKSRHQGRKRAGPRNLEFAQNGSGVDWMENEFFDAFPHAQPQALFF